MSIADDWEDGELYKDLAKLKVENAELRKDKQRLDWLLKEASIAYVCWSIDSREQIDEEMRGTEL